MKTWRSVFDATWLAKGDVRSALDSWVRRHLTRHRGLLDDVHAAESVAPWSVETLAHSIGAFGDVGQWLWCVTAISLMQELIFCAEGGGIDAAGVATDSDLARVVETLRAIRNAVIHPALQIALGEREPPIARLIKLLEADDDPEVTELAMRLPAAWSYLAERPTAMYALRKLNAAGELFVERNRLVKKLR
ncbi:MAG: hypothetical protein ABI704_11925 [Kofleriaceae bacterium]